MLVHDSMTDDSSFYISHTRVGVYILGIYLSSVILSYARPKNFRLLRRMLCGKTSSIRSDIIRHPPYNCIITAYLRPIYGPFTLPHRYHYVTSESPYFAISTLQNYVYWHFFVLKICKFQ